MKNLVPMPVLAAAGTSGPAPPPSEIYLNRTGLNSVEVPKDPAVAVIGTSLQLHFINRGAPIHITISSPNASMYTDFFQEPLYIVDEVLLEIPIWKDCGEGFFDLDIIAGYGIVKTGLKVKVRHTVQKIQKLPDRELPLQPVARGRPHILMVMMWLSLILYSSWLYTRIEFLNLASFLLLIIGALYTWYRQA